MRYHKGHKVKSALKNHSKCERSELSSNVLWPLLASLGCSEVEAAVLMQGQRLRLGELQRHLQNTSHGSNA
jgi:hypothetical protein